MITKTHTGTALVGGTLLSLALTAAPLQAQTMPLTSDPTITDVAADAELAAEQDEMAGEKLVAEVDRTGEAAMETAVDDAMAATLRQRIGATPSLGNYGLGVVERDGRYSITGLIDESEDYATLQRLIGDLDRVDGFDASRVDNDVVVN